MMGRELYHHKLKCEVSGDMPGRSSRTRSLRNDLKAEGRVMPGQS